MPIKRAELRGHEHIVLTELTRFRRRKISERFFSAPTQELSLHDLHRVYDLHRAPFENQRNLEAAHSTGYRVLISERGLPVSAAELHLSPDGTPKLSNFNHGPFVRSSAEAIGRLTSARELDHAMFELRLLRSTFHRLMALWLVEPLSGLEYIHPLSPAPSGLVAGHLYEASGVIDWALARMDAMR